MNYLIALELWKIWRQCSLFVHNRYFIRVQPEYFSKSFQKVAHSKTTRFKARKLFRTVIIHNSPLLFLFSLLSISCWTFCVPKEKKIKGREKKKKIRSKIYSNRRKKRSITKWTFRSCFLYHLLCQHSCATQNGPNISIKIS